MVALTFGIVTATRIDLLEQLTRAPNGPRLDARRLLK
jgi:hypothetical protein